MDWIDYIGQWLSSWVPVSLASLVGILLAEALKALMNTFLNHESKKKLQEQKFDLDRSLEEFKSSLQEGLDKQDRVYQSMLELKKFDLNRREKDFSLYSSKRHETYLLLHQAILDAKSKVFSLRGFTTTPNFYIFSFSEMESWLNEHSFVDSQKKSVLDIWERDKTEAVRKVNELVKLIRESDASLATNKANNTMLDYQLYLSEEIFASSSRLISDIYKLNINYQSSNYNPVKTHEESELLKEKVNNEFDEITKKMKAELQKGYYEEIK
ncbi:hypothetical protein [Mitsuokella multacida]